MRKENGRKTYCVSRKLDACLAVCLSVCHLLSVPCNFGVILEVGKSISQLRMRLALRENPRPRSWTRSRWTVRTRIQGSRIKTLFKWSVLRPSGCQKLRKQHEQNRWSASDQWRRKRARRWRRTRKRPSQWQKTTKSRNCRSTVSKKDVALE